MAIILLVWYSLHFICIIRHFGFLHRQTSLSLIMLINKLANVYNYYTKGKWATAMWLKKRLVSNKYIVITML